MMCLECTNQMENEWGMVADDDIQLCHACYSNESIDKHGIVTLKWLL